MVARVLPGGCHKARVWPGYSLDVAMISSEYGQEVTRL